MKKDCLSVKSRTRSEEIFEVGSNEESHYKRRSFDGKARRISPVFARFDLASRMTKTPNYAELFFIFSFLSTSTRIRFDKILARYFIDIRKFLLVTKVLFRNALYSHPAAAGWEQAKYENSFQF